MIDFPQLPFKLNTDHELSKWRSESFFTKEPETICWLNHFNVNTSCLVDVGANIGMYSLYWLAINPENNCTACEPFLTNVSQLSANLDINNFASRCSIVKAPLSEIEQVVRPVISDWRVGASGFRHEPDSLQEGSKTMKTTTLDQLLENAEEPCIVKIDTDGTDFEILKGASQALKSKKIRSVLIESSEYQHLQIEEFLSEFKILPDEMFNDIENHSDLRRISAGKVERNRIYTLNY